MPSADEILLSRTGAYPEKLSGSEEETFAAQALRFQQVSKKDNGVVNGNKAFNQSRLKTVDNFEAVVEGRGEVLSPITMVTASLLRKSWFLLPTVIGSFFAIAYINIHWFMNAVLGEKFFCRLGGEWAMVKGGDKPEFLKQGEKAIGLGEKALIIFLDIIMLIISLVIVFFLILMDNAGQAVVEAGWESISNWVKSTFGS